jgi:hypothetical protein
MTAPEDAIVARLDRLIALFRLVHADELTRTRERIHSDAANALILDLTEDGWVGAGKLRDEVSSKTGLKDRAARLWIAELFEIGALERDGGGPTTRYRSSGLV